MGRQVVLAPHIEVSLESSSGGSKSAKGKSRQHSLPLGQVLALCLSLSMGRALFSRDGRLLEGGHEVAI